MRPSRLPVRRFRLVHLVVLVALVGTALLAGCGSDPKPEPSSTSSSVSAQDYDLAFARCLRARGVQVADPSPDTDSVAGLPAAGSGTEQAVTACQKKLGPAPGGQASEGTRQETERQLQVNRCLREHGVEIADPKPGEAMAGIPAGSIPRAVAKTCGLNAAAPAAGTP